jgi:hypothetical protein
MDEFEKRAKAFHWRELHGVHADDCEDRCSKKLAGILRQAFEEGRKVGYAGGIAESADICRNYAQNRPISMMRRQVAYACERRIRALAGLGKDEG